MHVARVQPVLRTAVSAASRSAQTRLLTHQVVQPHNTTVMASVGAKVAKGAMWAVPIVAAGALGVKATEEFKRRQTERMQVQAAEQRRQQQFYESYGEGATLEDLQRSVDAYEGRQ